MWTAIGLAFLFGIFIAVMALREQRRKPKRQPHDPLDQIFERLDASLDSLTAASADASNDEISQLSATLSPPMSRLTESQLIMLSDAHSYGQLVTIESNESDGIVVTGQGQMRTVNSLLRRGLLREIAPGAYRLTPAGDRAIFNAHRRN